jgi:hypothetical protein
VSVREAEREVVAAAECVCHSYRAYGGYTMPLSVNLRRLDDAVRVWQGLVRAAMLDSDTNGFDRSTVWSEENSNEQSNASEQAKTQRRQGCAAAKSSAEGDHPKTAASTRPKARTA